jgi:hypothetical protein
MALPLKKREHIMVRMFLNGEGSIARLALPDAVHRLASGQVFVVEFNSIWKDLVLRIHDRLKRIEAYLGFVEVLPDVEVHRIVFDGYEPTLKIEKGKVFVLFGVEGDESESIAEEMIQWARQKHGWLSLCMVKQETSLKNTIIDAAALDPLQLHEGIVTLGEQWDACCEHVIHKMADVAPEACHELLAAIKIVARVSLDHADARQVTTNLRRCMEKLSDALSPPEFEEGTPKDRMDRYIRKRMRLVKEYEKLLDAELKEFETRMRKLWKMFDKGVHEDWVQGALRPLVLRLILLLNDLLVPFKPAAQQFPVKPDDLFG